MVFKRVSEITEKRGKKIILAENSEKSGRKNGHIIIGGRKRREEFYRQNYFLLFLNYSETLLEIYHESERPRIY